MIASSSVHPHLRYRIVVVLTFLGTAFLVFAVRRPIAPSRPNVVLISIDTLRADRLGAYGHTRPTSPFIDSVAARGAVFEEVIAPIPATDPSHAAMLTGLHPMRTGVLANAMPLRPEFETMAEVFRRAGYATVAATGVYHLSERYGFDQGFDRFSSVAPKERRRTADAVNADVLRFVREYADEGNSRPLFLFVHYFDVHAPYMTHPEPTDYGRPDVSEALINELNTAYDAGVRSVDEHVREVWEALDRANVAGNTVVAITADHGEQLGEHGFTGGHADLYAETIRVPLIVAGPAIVRGRIGGTVSLMDVAPTLMDLAGLRFQGPTEGRTLRPALTRQAAVAPRRGLLVLGYPSYARSLGWREGPLYFIRNLEGVYKALAVGPIPQSEFPPATAGREAAWRDEGDRRIFSVPAVDYEPRRIVLDIAGPRGCIAEAVVSIAPGIDLSDPLKIVGSMRLQYSVARLDSSFVTVTPRSCAHRVTWRFLRAGAFEGIASDEAATVSTRLFNSLLAWRKNKDTNELFDVAGDPDMSRDVMGKYDIRVGDELAAALEAAFVGYRLDRPGDASFSSEERERLRSLGYIR